VYQAVDPAGTNPTLDGAEDPSTTVHPIWLRSDRTANTLTIITDQETIDAVNFEQAGTSLILGSSVTRGSDDSAPMRILYGARWTGSAAEMSDSDINAIHRELGWAAATESRAFMMMLLGVG
jgi:hypothetical protein